MAASDLIIRLAREEREAIANAAAEQGLTSEDWARRVLLEAAARIIGTDNPEASADA